MNAQERTAASQDRPEDASGKYGPGARAFWNDKLGDPATDEKAAVPLVASTGADSPRTTPVGSPDRSAAKPRFGVSWDWRFSHDWRIWIDRTPYNCTGQWAFRWRFNCGPLHIVRFA